MARRMGGEDRLLAWLRRAAGETGRALGDDAAVLTDLPSAGLAVTVDSQIAGVHVPADLDPAHFARRLLAVNLSDLAATGARPTHALLALSAPPEFDHRRFFRALLGELQRRGMELSGGDLARHSVLTASLTLLGTRPPEGRWLTRGAARPGQGLWLGGTLGESAAGRSLVARGARLAGASGRRVRLPPDLPLPRRLAAAARRAVRRHLLPEPQLELGAWLGTEEEGAAMDISDGLARDLPRLCRASGVGAVVAAAALPAPADFGALCRALGVGELDLLLGGGEDYVLLFTLPADREPPARFGCRRVGTLTRGRGLWLDEGDGRRPLPRGGWDHLG